MRKKSITIYYPNYTALPKLHREWYGSIRRSLSDNSRHKAASYTVGPLTEITTININRLYSSTNNEAAS